jgi:hypothetical protein
MFPAASIHFPGIASTPSIGRWKTRVEGQRVFGIRVCSNCICANSLSSIYADRYLTDPRCRRCGEEQAGHDQNLTEARRDMMFSKPEPRWT